MSSHHLPDPELVDYADLAARYATALEERDRQAKTAEIALLQLKQAWNELCRLRDALDHRRRHRSGLSTAAALGLALAALAGGFGIGVSGGAGDPAAVGQLACGPQSEP
jgi:hypothetical protein